MQTKCLLFLTGMAVAYFIFFGFLAFTEKGFYENGIITLMGIIFYSRITGYEIKHRKAGVGNMLRLKTRGKFLRPNYFLVLPADETKKLEKILKNKL